jgi:two-component system, OmpR family, KDP operon response regulator KdpE
MTNAQKPMILVIDDEPQMMKFVRLALSSRGYRVIEAATANAGLQQATAYTPDVVLLDLGLPDKDGIEVVKLIREWSTMPILIISARGQEDSKVKALEEGADDYITKPFGASELIARIRVALRHSALMRETTTAAINIGSDITVDLARRVVTRKGQEVHLTLTEYKLLVALVKHAGMVMTHRHLLGEVWGPGHSEQVQYLRVYMTQLRHKLEEDPAQPKYLLTELGVGYRLKADA